MKYWLFDGKDAQGPYEPEELKRLPGFGPESLICPDGAASADQWRPSQYYLVKPPPTTAETARPTRSQAPHISHGMGRIAEAGFSEEPSVLPAPRQEFRPKRSASPAAVLSGFLALAGAAGAVYYLNRQKAKPAPIPAPAAVAPAPITSGGAAPLPKPAVTDAQVQEAISFVQGFPAQSAGRRLPLEPFDVFSPRRWKPAATVGQALRMRSLLGLDEAASALLEKKGQAPRNGERELRRDPKRWAAYTDRFLKGLSPLNWEVNRSKDCPTQTSATGEPTCFEVDALLRSERDAPQSRHGFVADLTTRTLKPQDTSAWQDVDPRGLASWASKNLRLGEPVDETAAAQAAPVYGIPLAHHRHAARHAKIVPDAAEEPDQDLGPAAPETAHAAKPAAEASSNDGLDYTEPGAQPAKKPAEAAPAAADDQALEKALLDQPAQAQPAQPQAQPQPQQPQAQPQPQAQAPAPAQPAAANKPKSAMDMSVDELQKYLKRDAGATP